MSKRLKRSMSLVLAVVMVFCTVFAGFTNEQAEAAQTAQPQMWKFDFGSAPAPAGSTGGPVADGYIGITGTTLYTPEKGYGLDMNLASRFRGAESPDNVINDFVLGGTNVPFVFKADIPNGNYKVTLYSGDLLQTTSTYKTKVTIEEVAGDSINSRRAVESKVYNASVADGQLNIQLTGDGTFSVLNAVIIEQVLPSAPEGLMLTSISANGVSMKWTAVTDAVYYHIYRTTGGSEPSAPIAEQIKETSYSDANVSVGDSYTYYVSSVNAFGQQSPLSTASEAALIPMPQSPVVPINLAVTEVNAASIRLAWGASVGAADYVVYRSDAVDGTYGEIGQSAALSYIDQTANTAIVQYYKIKARNGQVLSDYSAYAASTVYVPPVVLPDGDVKRFDFGKGWAADGYVSVSSAAAYSAERKYGFGDPAKVSFVDRGTADALRSDFSIVKDTSFIVDLPNADYTVSLIAGDLNDVTDISITVENMEKVKRLDGNAVRPAGQFLEMSFDIALVDGQLNFEFAGTAPKINALVITKKAERTPSELPTIYLAGDSTVQTYDPYWLPQAGWGQMIPSFFSENVIFKNHAIGGRSTKNFISEGRLDEVLRAIKPGDYFLVQFGHNDATISVPDRYASPADYKNYLKTYVNGAKQRGATPILVTPMGRRSFNAETGKFNVSFPEYVQAMKEVGQELDVNVVDLSTLSIAYYDSIGPAATLSVFLHTPAGVYGAFPNGSADDTHFQEYGAIQLARMLSAAIKQLDLPLAQSVKEIELPANVPAKPTSLIAGSISNAGALLKWDKTATADIYKIYRKLSSEPDSAYAMIGTSTLPTLNMGGLVEGNSYHVYVTAVNGKGESAPSDPIFIQTKSALYKYDFGTIGGVVEAGYTEVTRNTIYTAERGYGITDSTGMIDRDRGAGTDALRRDFVAYFGNSYEFKVDQPNGYYSVKTYTGDWIGSTKTNINIENKDYGTVSSGKENIAERVFNMIAVKDGQLNMILSGQTAHLNGVEITPLLLAPTKLELNDLDLSSNPIKAELSWTGVADAVKYHVYRKATVASSAELLGVTTQPTFIDTSADVGLEYVYSVSAIDNTGFESVTSNFLQVSMIDPNVEKAAIPTGLALASIHKNDISFTWDAVPQARMYNVYRAKEANGPYTLIGKSSTASYTDNTVLTTIPYYYKVASVNEGGISELSDALETQAITTLVRAMEYLDRSPVAIKTENGNYLGWRMLGLDPESIGFNVYRDGIKLNNELITKSTNYVDAAGTDTSLYHITSVLSGVEQAATSSFGVWQKQYKSVPLQKPADDYTKDGQPYTYSAGDASVGDLDGDGKYEIVMLWLPSNSKDNSQAGYTGIVYMDAYKFDGTRLWRINLGPNIRAGAHYTQFMVYDLDGDGRAEVTFKTADGTIDGTGKAIGDPSKDYRNSSGYVLLGNEYLTVFEGLTGKALATTEYDPPRGDVAAWGDAYGNRVDRFLAAVAYLDGEKPSLVFSRGYYTRTVLAAYDYRNGQLTKRWVFDSNDEGNGSFAGQGNHNLSIGDSDGDGKDEIHFGAMGIDDDGKPLYNTGLGHGDAMHFGDLDPERPGLEIFAVQEHSDSPYGMDLKDARTGEIIWGIHTGVDTGRGMSADLDPRYLGEEMWSANIVSSEHIPVTGLYSAKGEKITTSIPSSTNFGVWWDGDLLRELQDYNRIDKWDYMNAKTVNLLTAVGSATNNSTKANSSLQADLFGDWREEIMWRSEDSSEFRIYSTVDETEYRIRTLMHDPNYRLGVAWQNVAYNQPPHPSFYLGDGMAMPAAPNIQYIQALVTSITVTAAGQADSVKVGSTLQMNAEVHMDTAANKNVVWSVVNEDGSSTTLAAIGTDGLLHATAEGKVTVVATAADGSGVKGEKKITLLADPVVSPSPTPTPTPSPTPDSPPGGTAPTPTPAGNQVTVEAVTVNGKATAVVEAADLQKAIEAATKSLTIKVNAVGSAKSVEISIRGGAFAGLNTKDAFSLTMDTGSAKVTLSNKALKGALGAGTETLKLSIDRMDTSGLSEAIREKVGDGTVYDFNLYVGDKKISEFAGGKHTLEISVPYVLKLGEKPGNVVVYYIADDGKFEIVRNGKYDAKTGMITFKTNHFSYYSSLYAASAFTDLNQALWAIDPIEALAARSIVNGYGDGSFQPSGEVTRGAFVKMLMLALELEDREGVSSFSDVKAGAWYASSIAAAEKLGIIKGKSDGTFGVNELISRQDMAVMAYRAAEVAGLKLVSGSAIAFTNQEEIADYAAKAVQEMQSTGILNGMSGNTFMPNGWSTRAQAAKVIYSMMRMLE
ncbi:S-layer homology domain-containing protein [Paenibacillus sp. NRS-1760]|uniref:rhamnogalacturonan lyase family protein n=1 Tax=Paenibacillus sp. NRS-1760 TaxID=3233902 RepID=UPI003D283C26